MAHNALIGSPCRWRVGWFFCFDDDYDAVSNNSSTTAAKAAVVSKKPATVTHAVTNPKTTARPSVSASLKEIKAVKQFERQMEAAAQPADNTVITANDAIQSLANGSVNQLTAYDAVKAAKDACSQTSYDLGTMQVPGFNSRWSIPVRFWKNAG